MPTSRHYIALKSTRLPGTPFDDAPVQTGDVLVHQPAYRNSLAVFRAGRLIATIEITALALTAMMREEWIAEIVAKPPKTRV